MSYNNSPVMPNKYLLPDGSITTFAGVEWAAADSDRADTYKQIQWQAAKWLMPDGSIVSAIPISTDSLDAIYVPLTRTINGKALSANITLTSAVLETSVTINVRTASIYRLGKIETQPIYYNISGNAATRTLKLGQGILHKIIYNNTSGTSL
jgi:hypothetical protein